MQVVEVSIQYRPSRVLTGNTRRLTDLRMFVFRSVASYLLAISHSLHGPNRAMLFAGARRSITANCKPHSFRHSKAPNQIYRKASFWVMATTSESMTVSDHLFSGTKVTAKALATFRMSLIEIKVVLAFSR